MADIRKVLDKAIRAVDGTYLSTRKEATQDLKKQLSKLEGWVNEAVERARKIEDKKEKSKLWNSFKRKESDFAASYYQISDAYKMAKEQVPAELVQIYKDEARVSNKLYDVTH